MQRILKIAQHSGLFHAIRKSRRLGKRVVTDGEPGRPYNPRHSKLFVARLTVCSLRKIHDIRLTAYFKPGPKSSENKRNNEGNLCETEHLARSVRKLGWQQRQLIWLLNEHLLEPDSVQRAIKQANTIEPNGDCLRVHRDWAREKKELDLF